MACRAWVGVRRERRPLAPSLAGDSEPKVKAVVAAERQQPAGSLIQLKSALAPYLSNCWISARASSSRACPLAPLAEASLTH